MTEAAGRDTDYKALAMQAGALLEGETDAFANAANFVALLWHAMPDINWLGIYRLQGEELVLGPFQGRPACTRIELGKGVCGTAAATGKSQRVEDVHRFAGHIACDPASRSELVVPLKEGDRVFAVLDIDSPSRGRFSAGDQAGVELLCRKLESSVTGLSDST